MYTHEVTGAHPYGTFANLNPMQLLMVYGALERAAARTGEVMHEPRDFSVSHLKMQGELYGLVSECYWELMERIAVLCGQREFITTLPTRGDWERAGAGQDTEG